MPSIRITNSMMVATFMTNLNNNMSRMNNYASQMATNKRINRLADDPVGLLTATQARSKLYRMEYMNRNLDDAKSILQQGESSLMEINKVIQRAYELVIDGSTDVKTTEDRSMIAEEIDQLKEHILNLANSTVNDKYIFGGYNTTQKPFTIDSNGQICYNGVEMTTANLGQLNTMDLSIQEYQVAFGDIRMDISVGGGRLLGTGDENIFTMLDNLARDLRDDTKTADDIGAYVAPLQKQQSHFLAITADYGGRNNRLDMMIARFASDEEAYAERKSKAEDAEEEEVIMRFKMAEAVYQAALATGARIIQPSLMDYLR